MRIEFSTLCAEVEPVGQNVDEYEVVLSFGRAEIVRWLIPPERARYFTAALDDRAERLEVEHFVAEKLTELFKIK